MLPTIKTAPKAQLSDYTVLLYGASKAGKTTFCSAAQDALFLATEPGLNALEVFQVSITKWDDMLQACAEIAEGKHQFKTIIIDTIDNAYKMCADHKHKNSGADQRTKALGMSPISATARAMRSSTTRSGRPTPFPACAQRADRPALRLILISPAHTKEVDTESGVPTRAQASSCALYRLFLTNPARLFSGLWT